MPPLLLHALLLVALPWLLTLVQTGGRPASTPWAPGVSAPADALNCWTCRAVIGPASSPLGRWASSLNLKSTRARRSAGVADHADVAPMVPGVEQMTTGDDGGIYVIAVTLGGSGRIRYAPGGTRSGLPHIGWSVIVGSTTRSMTEALVRPNSFA